MDDIFGDDFIMDEIDSGLDPSPNPPSLRASQSAMSLTEDSPRTSAATLFRPAQPRNTPASASNRPAALRNSFKKFAEILKLTKENQDMVQQIYNNTLPNEEYLATLSFLVYLRQDGGLGGTAVSKWVPGRVIRETFKDAVRDFILRPNLQAFSKTVASDHTTLVESLEILTFNFCQNLDPDIVDEHGPGDYNAGDACIPGTTMHTFIKETLKNQRSKVRSVLLEHILGVPEGFLTPVLQAKPMVLLVARTLRPNLRKLGGEEVLDKLGRQAVKWIIFMRYVTVYNHLNPTQNKKRCQWTVMDEVLAELRTRPTSERTLYFNEVVRYDRETFTGKRTWDTIRSSGQLPAPTVAQVLERAQATEAGASGSGGGDITGGLGSGNEDDGEETEEQT
ncbi:hypothetical protein DFH28DRAFT_1084390 [Melampsora americana]|nr:hypothetical protein DFH28DRAFT_1084390 [Melampsora americana]